MPTILASEATTYGALSLSGATLTILGIVSAALFVLATGIYVAAESKLGLAPHFVGFILLLVLFATWLTGDVDWDNWGPFPVIGAVVIAAAYIVLPLIIVRIKDKLF